MSEDRPPPACPICGAPRAQAFRPFCSRRCADVDLNRWLSGRYALPAQEDEPTDEPAPGEEIARARKPN